MHQPFGITPASTQLLPRNGPIFGYPFVNNQVYFRAGHSKIHQTAASTIITSTIKPKQLAKELRYFEPLFDYSDVDLEDEPTDKRSAPLTIPEGFKIYEAVPTSKASSS